MVYLSCSDILLYDASPCIGADPIAVTDSSLAGGNARPYPWDLDILKITPSSTPTVPHPTFH